MKQINKYFRNCDKNTQQTKSDQQITLKSTLEDNITILNNLKNILENFLSNNKIQLSNYEEFIKNNIGDISLPELNLLSTTFTLYLKRIHYSSNNQDINKNNLNIPPEELCAKLIKILEDNIALIQSLLKLEDKELFTKLKEHKQIHVKPIHYFVNKHINNISKNIDISIDYIVNLISVQIHNFLFDIPLYTYHNIYEKQIHIQKRLKKCIVNIIHLCNVSPFHICIDLSFNLIQQTYTIQLNFDEILDVIDYKTTQSQFSLEELYKHLVASELNHYIHIAKNIKSKISIEQMLQNLLFESAIQIYNNLIPINSSFNFSNPILVDTTDDYITSSSTLTSDINIHVCKGKSIPELTGLISLIFYPKNNIPHAIEDLLKSKNPKFEGEIITIIDNPDILLFNIESVKEVEFMLLLDIFLGLCNSGNIKSFGKLSQTFNFTDISNLKNIKSVTNSEIFKTNNNTNSTNITYYIESTCKKYIIDKLSDSKFIISKDIIKLNIVL